MIRKVLVLDAFSGDGLSLLRSDPIVHVDESPPVPEDELVGLVPPYAAMIVRSQTKVTARVLEAGRSLRVVGRAGAGLDNIDVAEASRRGITVLNTPSANTLAAAEHTFALMLALARHVPAADASVRAGVWTRSAFVGIELHGKTLGVCGFGRIGREVASRARAFGMRVLACDPFVQDAEIRAEGCEPAELGRLLAESDFLTLHLPSTAETRGIVSREVLAGARRGLRLVNTARGALVNEQALLEALDSGAVAGAALDVFAIEPPPPGPLLRHPKVVVTPHLGASTREAQARVGVEIAGKVLEFLRSSEPRGPDRDAGGAVPPPAADSGCGA